MHEFVHGLVWKQFCVNGWKSINFGIKSFSPYCHCSEILKVRHYRIGTLAPMIVTGIIPFIISMITGNVTLFEVSIFLILSAGGDLAILFTLRNVNKDDYVMDHENLCGCFVFRK